MKKNGILILLTVTLLVCALALGGCGKDAEEAVSNEDITTEENAQAEKEETAEASAEMEPASEEPAETNVEPAEKEAPKEEPVKEKPEKKKKEEKQKSKAKKKTSSGKTEKEKEKKWVDPVYKTVDHPEEGHYETVTEWYCLCGKYVGSKEGWKKHREDFIASNGGVCNGEHVRPDPKEKQVWVVDKEAWSEKVLVSEGHWE